MFRSGKKCQYVRRPMVEACVVEGYRAVWKGIICIGYDALAGLRE